MRPCSTPRCARSIIPLNCPESSRAQCAREHLNPEALPRVCAFSRRLYSTAARVVARDHQDNHEYIISFQISGSGIAALFAITGAFALFTNNASAWTVFPHASSGLAIESQGSTASEFRGFRAVESRDKLYVTGSIRKRPGHTLLSHVDVQLVDAQGRVIAEVRESISYRHPSTGNGKSGRSPFVASFPLAEARQASKIIVTYHSARHGS